MDERVTAYIAKHPDWQQQMNDARKVFSSLPLQETLKWGAPCYTYEGKHVVGIAGFKKPMALWFHQGALLSDPHDVLINAQEGKTRAQRQWRFGAGEKLPRSKVKRYAQEAIKLMQSGQVIAPERGKPLEVPPQLASALDHDPALASAFKALTPGRQREYAAFIREARQAQTQVRRLEKIIPLIQSGQGLNDKYRG